MEVQVHLHPLRDQELIYYIYYIYYIYFYYYFKYYIYRTSTMKLVLSGFVHQTHMDLMTFTSNMNFTK